MRPSRPGTATKKSRQRVSPVAPSWCVAKPPPASPVKTVSAAQDARTIDTTASAALPPWPRISPPTPAAETLPAATDTGKPRRTLMTPSAWARVGALDVLTLAEDHDALLGDREPGGPIGI